jgi:hypothetical protein
MHDPTAGDKSIKVRQAMWEQLRTWESILALRRAFRMRFTIHFSALSSSMLSFSDNIFRSIHWWMRQYVSKMNNLQTIGRFMLSHGTVVEKAKPE